MSAQDKRLSPDSSPQTLDVKGVRRVNNRPIILVLGLIMVFVLLIALVAVKRANDSNREEVEVKSALTHSKNTLSMAEDIISAYPSGIIPSANEKKRTSRIALPIAVVADPSVPPKPYVHEPLPDAELERIRQEKTQQFEDAVNAHSAVSFNKESITTHSRQGGEQPLASNNVEIMRGSNLQTLPMEHTVSLPLGGVEEEQRWDLHSRVHAPKTPFVLTAGSVIPGGMISGIRSDLPGQITGQVSQNVYDTATGRYLLIPQGTKVFGVYSSEVSFGQDSLLVAWQRLIFPDGKTLDIGSMPGTDSAGYSGFRDRVNHHYARIFGSALLMSGIVGGITYSQNQEQPAQGALYQPSAGSVLSQALGQQLGEVTAQLIMKNLNVAPSLEIGPGYPFNIVTVKDLVFTRPYSAFDYSIHS